MTKADNTKEWIVRLTLSRTGDRGVSVDVEPWANPRLLQQDLVYRVPSKELADTLVKDWLEGKQ